MFSPDRAGFEEYVAARMPALLRTAYLLTGHHQDAEDLVQTALVKAVPKWGGSPQDGQFTGQGHARPAACPRPGCYGGPGARFGTDSLGLRA